MWPTRPALPLLLGLALAALGCDSPPPGCSSSRECSGAGLVCDTAQGLCVECNADADCLGADEACRASTCVILTPCVSSRECPGRVCDLESGFCADCVTDVDCPGERVCLEAVCVAPPTPCASDRECGALDQVCDRGAGRCVDCVANADCPGALECRAQRCVASFDAGVVDAGRSDSGAMDSGLGDAGIDAGADDAGADDAGPDATVTADAGVPSCAAFAQVASPAELAALAPSAWGTVGETWYESSYSTSMNIEATAGFSFSANTFAAPSDCSGCSMRFLVLEHEIAGVSGSSTVTVTAGARFRLRFNVADDGLAIGIVLVQPPPCVACVAGERRCAEDLVCYALGRTFCRACDHGTLARCECVGEDGLDRPDDAPCTVDGGGDSFTGTCQSGVCTP